MLRCLHFDNTLDENILDLSLIYGSRFNPQNLVICIHSTSTILVLRVYFPLTHPPQNFLHHVPLTILLC